MAKKKRRGHNKRSVKKSLKTPKNPEQGGRGKYEVRGRGDSGLLLTDEHHVRNDIKMVEMAVRKGWNVRRKTMLRRRLEDIAEKTEAEVITKDGVVTSETAADEIAINAIKVLVQMDAQDVNRVAKVINPPQPNKTQVNINVGDTEAEQRRARLVELSQRLGVTRLVIDGRAVPVAGVDRATVPASSEGKQQ